MDLFYILLLTVRHLAKHVSLDPYEQRLEHCRFYGIITLLTLNTSMGAQTSVGPGINDLERRKISKRYPMWVSSYDSWLRRAGRGSTSTWKRCCVSRHGSRCRFLILQQTRNNFQTCLHIKLYQAHLK